MTLQHFPFYYIRHGETDWNAINRIMGHKDIPLNENGIRQVHETIPIIQTLEFKKIWSSPLLRARQTAEIISEYSGVEIEYSDFLKERGWGIGEGESHEQFFPDMTELEKGTRSNRTPLPEGAETWEEFEARVSRIFKEILMQGYPIPLVVSHGGVFRVLTTLLAAKEITSAKNCDLYYFKPPQNLHKMWEVVNITKSEFDEST